MKKLTPFEEQVYRVVKGILKGKTLTYKEVAKRIDKPRAYRAVGNALKKSPGMPQVPCHRVIKRDGSVGGYAYGTKNKIALLRREGIQVSGEKVVTHKSSRP